MKKSIIYVGLDVHKNSIAVALAYDGRDAEVRSFGIIGGDLNDLDRLVKKLSSESRELRFTYEAGPCGYDIYRFLTERGFSCTVCSPAHLPKKSGVRVKTDRRDAITLARLHRAGELTKVFVPRAEDEAMRDVTRAREDAKKAQRTCRQQLGGMLLRLGIRYKGKTNWTPEHMRWLSDQKMPSPAQQVAFQEYLNAIEQTTGRVERLTRQIEALVPQWRLAPMIKVLAALRGVSLIVATTVLAELGDLARFEHPKLLMAFLGVVPSEHSSGDTKRRGNITKTGNSHARRALIEAAQAYSHPARITRHIRKRQEGVSDEIQELAWKCQVRLCGRFRRMMERGKNRNVAVTAIARELAAFMWAVAKRVEVA